MKSKSIGILTKPKFPEVKSTVQAVVTWLRSRSIDVLLDTTATALLGEPGGFQKTQLASKAHVIYGTAYDDSLGDQLRVTVIATGLSSARRAAAPLTVVQSQPQTVLRTGTDNLPVLSSPIGATAAPVMGATDYAGMATPSVWRTGRTQAAAKVEALSSNGMDEIEIPAFLRKQAD